MIKIVTYEVGSSFYRMNQTKQFEVSNLVPQKGNWSHAIYFFLKKESMDRYNDEEHKYPITVKNKNSFNCIVCDMECFANGSYTEDDMRILINEIKRLTKIESTPNDNFIQWLGDNKYAFQCYHDPDAMEIAIPFTLLDKNDWEITNINI